MNRFAELKRAAAELPFESYIVDRPVDDRGQYQLQLQPDFPLAVKLLIFPSQARRPLTWHTYLELFVLLSEKGRVQMGKSVVDLAGGDVLVMDHLKLHVLLDFSGAQAQAVVIRFLPDFVRGLAPSASDHLLLLPFYCQTEGEPHVLRRHDKPADHVHAALTQLLRCYLKPDEHLYWQTGSRAYFLEVLHHLARHFQSAERLKADFSRQQLKAGRLHKLFKFISENYANRISLPQAIAIAGLSKPRFHVIFKEATGMTFVAYLTRVRLAQAVCLLNETAQPIAEIASSVGFADQSHFDRRFRQYFGQTPLQFRKGSAS